MTDYGVFSKGSFNLKNIHFCIALSKTITSDWDIAYININIKSYEIEAQFELCPLCRFVVKNVDKTAINVIELFKYLAFFVHFYIFGDTNPV